MILILLVHGWALLTSAYFYIWWLDLLLHAAGGFWAGALGLYIFRETFLSGFLRMLAAVGFAALVGILWELLEFGVNQVWETLGRIAFLQPSLRDTMADLLADLAGSFFTFFLSRNSKKKL